MNKTYVSWLGIPPKIHPRQKKRGRFIRRKSWGCPITAIRVLCCCPDTIRLDPGELNGLLAKWLSERLPCLFGHLFGVGLTKVVPHLVIRGPAEILSSRLHLIFLEEQVVESKSMVFISSNPPPCSIEELPNVQVVEDGFSRLLSLLFAENAVRWFCRFAGVGDSPHHIQYALDIYLGKPGVPGGSLSGRIIDIHPFGKWVVIPVFLGNELVANREVEKNWDGLLGRWIVDRLHDPVSATMGVGFGGKRTVVDKVQESSIFCSIEMLKGGLTDARLGGRLHAWSGVLGIKANRAKIHISKWVAGGSLYALYIVVLKLWGRGVREQCWCG